MIWNDYRISLWCEQGGVSPFDRACINPASLDLRWSGNYRIYAGKKEANKLGINPGWTNVENVEELTLMPGSFYLLDSLEFIKMPPSAAGMLCLKSSLGRRGLEHSHAGFFDPGFSGTATWEIHCLCPDGLTIKREQRLMQLVMEECTPPLNSYAETGHYNGQCGPTEAR